MKKLIAVSSLLALALAGSGLFAYDILNSEGEKSGFSLGMQAEYEFDVITDDSNKRDNDKTWITELDADKQAKVTIGVAYDGDNYAFGVGAGFRQKRATDEVGADKEWYLDDAWGKYYFLEKQLWLRGGSMDGLWRIDTDPLNKNYGGDNKPGLQLNFAPAGLTGLNVGVALPVPLAGTRDDTIKGNWGPTYPIMNMVFGLRLNGTVPNLDIGTELDLLGQEATNGKAGDDEKEGEFLGMNWHLTAVYTFKPVTIKAAVVVEGIGNAVKKMDVRAEEEKVLDPLVTAGVRIIFDIPNGEGSPLDLGDPWVQLQMLPNTFVKIDGTVFPVAADKTISFDGGTTTWPGLPFEKKSFKDIAINFEWEPNYSIVPDQIKAYLWLGVAYKIWADVEDESPQKKYPLEFAVRPKLEFKFAPNATLAFQDKIFFVRQEKEKGFRNEVGLRFAWNF